MKSATLCGKLMWQKINWCTEMMQIIKIWAKMSIKAHTLGLHCVKMAIDFENRFSSPHHIRSKEDVEACLGANGFFLTTLERRPIE